MISWISEICEIISLLLMIYEVWCDMQWFQEMYEVTFARFLPTVGMRETAGIR